MKFLLVAAVVLFSNLFSYADANKLWNMTDVDRLKKDLLEDYDPLTRPSNAKDANSLHVSITLINIDLDEKRGVLTTHAWLKMNWSDVKLSWDPKAYDGIQEMRVGADEIWSPDLTVYNSAEHNIVDHFAKTNKIVYPSGAVLWVPTAKIETYCSMDLVYWPFDRQTCTIKMGSWTYSGFQINLKLEGKSIDLSEIHENSEWKIVKARAERHEKYYPCCAEPYPDVTFELTFERSSPMYKAIVVSPVMLIIFMTLVSFWLPPQSGEKLLVNGIAATIICVLLLYFSQQLTIHAASAPFIVTFYSHTLYLLCFSFVISVIVINISRNRKHYAVPRSIKLNISEGCIGRMLGGGPPRPAGSNSDSEDQQETQLNQHSNTDEHKITQSSLSLNSPSSFDNHQLEWIRLAKVIDRMAFLIYLFVYVFIGALHFFV